MARFMLDFKPHISWAPYWYFGFPFHLFYTPLLPVFEVLFYQSAGLSLWQAYRWVTGFGLILAPVALFFFTLELTKKVIPGLIAALGYTFLPSLFYFVISTGEVADDVFSAGSGNYDPRRLVILARWGEGPHILSLVFLPLAGLFYYRVLRHQKLIDYLLTGIFIGLTAMSNAVGLYGLALLLLALFVARVIAKPKQINRFFKTSLLAAAVTYGLIAFWYNLSFMRTFFSEGGGVLKNYAAFFPWGYLIGLWILLMLYVIFNKLLKYHVLTIGFIWFAITFLIVYIYYTSAPPQFSEQRIEYAPQALRLMTEADMAFAFFLAAITASFIYFLEKKNKVLGIIGNLISVGLVIILTA